MTGYGRSIHLVDGRELLMEIRSVNHRYLDLSIRLPREIGFIEEEVRSMVSGRLSRGHLDITASYSNHRQDAKRVVADLPLAAAYRASIGQIAEELFLPEENLLREIIAFPDVLRVEVSEEDQEAVRALAAVVLEDALDQIEQMRLSEGSRLRADMLEKADHLAQLRLQIAERAPQVVEEYQSRLRLHLSALLNGEMDESRFLTEVAVFADRASIDEELVRMESHLAQLHTMADASEPVGRKLDFLVQEMNREMNTIGSKALDKQIAALVIEAKSDIEKIREQIQNIE